MSKAWPDLPYASWKDTCETLHRYTQIVGKIQLALTPRINHFWNVALRLSSRGLRTKPMPADGPDGGRYFDLAFDFVDHELFARTSDGEIRTIPLRPRPVSRFFSDVSKMLESLQIAVAIDDHPAEIIENAIPFRVDDRHASYDPEAVNTWWKIMLRAAYVFDEFRSRFVGKASPSRFYWGSFDLATSRYSGRRAPPRSDADSILKEAMSHEDISVGLWPGNDELGGPLFYSYTAPPPAGIELAEVEPVQAYYDTKLGEFLLPYTAVSRSTDPRGTLMRFLQSTYEAGANLAGWDRQSLERGFRSLPWTTGRPLQPPPSIH